jgi:heme exporter protein B
VLRDAVLVAGKDLRIEWRSRVATNQVLPFAVVVLVLFAFALDPDRGLLRRATAGLFWVTVLFCALLAVQRSFAIESADGGRDALRLSALDPGAVFLGKAAALVAQLVALEVLLGVGVVVLYDTAVELDGTSAWAVGAALVATALVATIGLAAAGTLYGVLAAGLRVRETLLPLLLLPVTAPVLIGATRAFESALDGVPAESWPWTGLLGVFALVYTALGLVTFGSLLEES